jgi:hypothetical protein
MQDEASVRMRRELGERLAVDAAERRDFYMWLRACGELRIYDWVLRDHQLEGYVDPTDRIPFPAERAA